MTASTRRHLLAGAAIVAAAAALPASAQTSPGAVWPTKTVQIILPFAAGGLTDLVARPLAQGLQKELGQPVIVVSKPGAGGSIGIQHVAAQESDGHTLLLTLSSITTLPAIAAATGQPVPFKCDQFEPLARFAADPALIYVHKDAPWKTVDELVADAKKRPDGISFTSSGRNGPTHLPVAMLSQATGTQMRHVPATGGGPAMTLLLGANVDLFFTVPSLGMEQVKAGNLRVLATSTAERLPALPNVPTLKERGIDVDYAVWVGLFAVKGVPGEARARLGAAITKIAADPEFKASLAKTGVDLAYQDAPTFKAWWDADAVKTEAIIKLINGKDNN
jgi:tripartite-type tricarboxylate transporter receptor subunit TctC